MRHARLAVVAAVTLVLTGCAGDPDATSEPTAATSESTDPADDSSEANDVVEGEAPEPVDLGDRPEAHSSQFTQGVAPALATVDGEITIALVGAALRSSIPMIVHNGTADPISRLEISGAVVDAEGGPITSGSSQGFEPNVIEPGGYAIGYVYAGPDDLPAGAQLNDPAIDFTVGLGEYDDIVALDITTLDANAERITGSIQNTLDVAASGPISVAAACIDEDGSLIGLWSTFADRDEVEAGGSSTFTIDFYGDGLPCAGLVAGASGYNAEA